MEKRSKDSIEVGQGLSLVKVVEWDDEINKVRIFKIPTSILADLRHYLINGTAELAIDVRKGLQKALSNCPNWVDRDIGTLDTVEKQSIVALFVIEIGNELAIDHEINLSLK